jgi:hypothetical protein
VATIRRCEVTWSGLTGLPGLSVFHAPAGIDPTGSLVTFFNAIKGVFPTPLTWDIPNTGDELSDSTGVLTGGWAGAGGGAVVGTAAAPHAAGTGAFVSWATTAIVGGRRLKGRTFLAPLWNSGYDGSGTILLATQTTLQTACNALASSGVLVVWHRPTTPGGSDGVSHAVSAGTVPDKVTSLRSRRT